MSACKRQAHERARPVFAEQVAVGQRDVRPGVGLGEHFALGQNREFVRRAGRRFGQQQLSIGAPDDQPAVGRADARAGITRASTASLQLAGGQVETDQLLPGVIDVLAQHHGRADLRGQRLLPDDGRPRERHPQPGGALLVVFALPP